MSFPDLSDIRNRVRSLMDEDSNSIFLTDSVLNRFINDAERDIAIKTGCIENIDSAITAISSRSVKFSGYKVNYVEYVHSSGLSLGLKRTTLEHLGRIPINGSDPQYWVQWGGNIIIEPVPNYTYNLNVYVTDYPHVEMSNDTDEPTIPSSFHEDIVKYSLFRSLLRDRKYNHASFIYNGYINSIQQKKKLIIEQRSQTRNEIKIPDYTKTKK